MNEKKQNILIVVGLLVLVGMIGGIAYSFFNYSRTGTVNTVKTGGLTFSAEQDGLVTLDGLFPISETNNITSETPGVGSLAIHVTGSTDYSSGIEYLVKAVNVTTPASGQELPISIIISYTANNNKTIGTLDNSYYTNRGHDTSLYKVLSTDTIEENGEIVVGYIAPGQTGIDGNITILAYLDADDIAITDTEGADNDWLQGRTVFTTEEWNALENEGVSFQLKVEAQEGIWAEEKVSAFEKITRNVITGTTIDFSQASSSTNGQGLYQLNEASGNNYPIYYYRGAVTDNNVIFGGYCWQIVRTTETGGIKMVYNGVATGDGKTCENTTGASRQLATQYAFNTSSDSLSNVGYMYNKRYESVSGTPTTDAYFGSGVSYNGNSYTLTGIYQNDNVTKAVKDNDHHYTCNSASSYECPEVRYYYYNNYYITLSEGETIEDAIYKMTGNGTAETKAKTINQNYKLNNTDSKAKDEIEKWFKTNLTNEEDESKINYQEYLEDTIFCNDRSFKTITGNTSNPTYTESGWNPNGGDQSKLLYFGTFNRYRNNYYSTSNKPVLSCENVTDQFSKSNPEATLKYSVGLLTADEIILGGLGGNGAGLPSGNYLRAGNIYWSLSPSDFLNGSGLAREFYVNANGTLYDSSVAITVGLRPVVSLKLGTEFESGGEGTSLKPYVVKIAE